MIARTAFRTLPATARTVNANTIVAGRRWNTLDARGGKSKLIFRFGMRDLPVELYPLGFVVGVALVGAGIASARHFLIDDELRLKRSGGASPV